jgi:CBS domain-containing protein
MAEPSSLPRHEPSSSLLGNLRAELMRDLPFSEMTPRHVEQFIAAAEQAYFAPGEVVLEPACGPVTALHCIRRGSVSGRRGLAETAGPFEYGAGELFPVGAVLAHRAVTATYTANEDTFCLLLPAEAMQRLTEASPPFADFLNRRVMHFLELSRRALQSTFASQTLAQQSLEARLSSLPRKEALACRATTPLAEALALMHARRVGSVLVVDEAMAPLGILTRHDVLGRITLPQRALGTPIGEVMSTPVHSLTVEHTLQDAALLMSSQGVRHLPVTEQGRLVNIVSERDLFALQRLSIKQLSTQIRSAQNVDTLRHLAGELRRFAGHLLGQGVMARQLTALISHLNDLLTERLLELAAARHALDLGNACWLSFGSEGRSEQTVATDQDNGLIFVSADPDTDRPRWLALARDVNQSLDACGYPLCPGQVMAGNPACCLTADEWAHRFAHWIEHGAPEDLLNASIYFDLRPLGGRAALAQPLQALLLRQAAGSPRFLKQMADNVLRRRPALNWRGALDTQDHDGRAMLDLKLQGTAVFVDAARLYALAHGLPALGTRARLEAAAPMMHVAAQESEAWIAGFEFLQMLRLQVQIGAHETGAGTGAGTGAANANLVDTAALNQIDRHMLKETMRIARRLQQRIALDYQR